MFNPGLRRARDGGTMCRQTISERHGGAPAAILRIQPPLHFVNGDRRHFWGGLGGVRPARRQPLDEAPGCCSGQVLPLRFSTAPGLAMGISGGQVDRFYRAPAGAVPVAEF